MEATILHADLDAFYASVEQLLDPSLRGKPIAVGGGVVLAASYEAKAFGVRGGMPGRRARELCPQLIFVGGHFKDYQRLGDAAIEVLGDFTPLVERISIDEAFADVAGCTHLFGPPAEIAQAIRRRVRDRARPADLGRRGAHQASGEDRLAGGQARRAGGRRSRDRARIPARSAGRADVGRRAGHQGAARRDRRARPSGSWRGRRDGRSSGCSAARPARSSRRSPGTAIRARSGRIGARTRPARSRRSAGSLPKSASSGRRCVHLADRIGTPAARQIAARPDRDGARALRRPALGHPLA